MSEVIVRIPPSPTGLFHIGTARTALFNYLFAKKHGGKVLLRFEDTDIKRSRKEFEDNAIDALEWLGIEVDEVIRQSERSDLYSKKIKELIDKGVAYISSEKSKDDPTKEVSLVRFRNQKKPVVFSDALRGDIEMDISDLGDFVIARSVSDPLYNLAVVIDDACACVTHVIRGDDHISNTPQQVVLLQALGHSLPVYVHIPLIHSSEGGKLSKRNSETVSVTDFKEKGYLPEALINYIAFLGWNPKTNKEIFSLSELIEVFSFDGLQKQKAIFSKDKLDWYNQNYIRELEVSKFIQLVEDREPGLFPADEKLREAVACDLKSRAVHLEEAVNLLKGSEYAYFFSAPSLDENLLLEKGNAEITKKHLEEAVRLLSKCDTWEEESIKETLWGYASEMGRGEVLWPIRVSLSGKEKSPSPFYIACAIGKEETLGRLESAASSI